MTVDILKEIKLEKGISQRKQKMSYYNYYKQKGYFQWISLVVRIAAVSTKKNIYGVLHSVKRIEFHKSR